MQKNVSDAKERKVWFNGTMIPSGEATVPILTHSLQYGSGIFEGIRCYEGDGSSNIFRLKEHVARFLMTAKMYGLNLGYDAPEISRAIVETVKVNNLRSCYIRPFAFVDDDAISLGVGKKKVSTTVSVIPYDSIFGSKKSAGIRCKVSSWRRINSNILPIQAKASGNYINSIIAANEASATGFDEAILLSEGGYLAEGTGENIFIVKDGTILTPGKDSDILLGITRESIIDISRDLGYSVIERRLHRDELYTADEVFLAGTAAEVTPVVNVDGLVVGDGKVGRITSSISDMYYGIVTAKEKKYSKWLTPVK
ncbi:branched-chain amino acid transaminase [Oxyplasma meridianum]|uniref:Branched-chain-amino-acid aminotransferase n=1 Tax=Oxyplasma meridianum TaxID=3073602 RepID=A0AAX4NHL5_9ARCH